MSGKLWSLGVFGLTLVLCASGCKSCGSGRDPLLGKTRVDPPTTNARSVYVERQNVNECGVVPGGGCATSVSSEIPASSDPAGIIQPGAGSVQTVYYPNGLDSAGESVPVSQDEKPAENVHLHWVSAEVPQNEGRLGPSLSDLGTRELTEEELANYRYVYDFSVMPPRKVPVGRSAGAVPSEKTAAGNPAAQVSAPDPYIPQTGQLVSQNFDPYAPNRQFERRKAKLSRVMANEFDEAAPSPAPVQTANYDAPRNEAAPEPARVAQTQISAKDSGWRVISTQEGASSASPLSNEAVADSQIAPVQQSVGTKAQVPGKGVERAQEKAPEKVQEKASEKSQENAPEKAPENTQEKARKNVRETVPQNLQMDDDSAVDLFDLPRK